jgi:hypothetical protein
MKAIAKYLIPFLGLTWLSLHFGCQGPTLVTKTGPSSKTDYYQRHRTIYFAGPNQIMRNEV